jgi:hypothetical protein
MVTVDGAVTLTVSVKLKLFLYVTRYIPLSVSAEKGNCSFICGSWHFSMHQGVLTSSSGSLLQENRTRAKPRPDRIDRIDAMRIR